MSIAHDIKHHRFGQNGIFLAISNIVDGMNSSSILPFFAYHKPIIGRLLTAT